MAAADSSSLHSRVSLDGDHPHHFRDADAALAHAARMAHKQKRVNVDQLLNGQGHAAPPVTVDLVLAESPPKHGRTKFSLHSKDWRPSMPERPAPTNTGADPNLTSRNPLVRQASQRLLAASASFGKRASSSSMPTPPGLGAMVEGFARRLSGASVATESEASLAGNGSGSWRGTQAFAAGVGGGVRGSLAGGGGSGRHTQSETGEWGQEEDGEDDEEEEGVFHPFKEHQEQLLWDGVRRTQSHVEPKRPSLADGALLQLWSMDAEGALKSASARAAAIRRPPRPPESRRRSLQSGHVHFAEQPCRSPVRRATGGAAGLPAGTTALDGCASSPNCNGNAGSSTSAAAHPHGGGGGSRGHELWEPPHSPGLSPSLSQQHRSSGRPLVPTPLGTSAKQHQGAAAAGLHGGQGPPALGTAALRMSYSARTAASVGFLDGVEVPDARSLELDEASRCQVLQPPSNRGPHHPDHHHNHVHHGGGAATPLDAIASALPTFPAAFLMGLPLSALGSMTAAPSLTSVAAAHMWHPPRECLSRSGRHAQAFAFADLMGVAPDQREVFVHSLLAMEHEPRAATADAGATRRNISTPTVHAPTEPATVTTMTGPGAHHSGDGGGGGGDNPHSNTGNAPPRRLRTSLSQGRMQMLSSSGGSFSAKPHTPGPSITAGARDLTWLTASTQGATYRRPNLGDSLSGVSVASSATVERAVHDVLVPALSSSSASIRGARHSTDEHAVRGPHPPPPPHHHHHHQAAAGGTPGPQGLSQQHPHLPGTLLHPSPPTTGEHDGSAAARGRSISAGRLTRTRSRSEHMRAGTPQDAINQACKAASSGSDLSLMRRVAGAAEGVPLGSANGSAPGHHPQPCR